MQPVLERGSIDKPLTFDVGLISVSYQSVHLIHATFQSNCAEGLHFSVFHYSTVETNSISGNLVQRALHASAEIKYANNIRYIYII